ncbi:STAS domain-containing protein [Streptosporangium lutulentum]
MRSWRLDSLWVLRLVGELDACTVPSVWVKLDRVLLTFEALTLVVDLTHVTFMASAGVGAMVEIQEKVLERSGRLMVVLPAGGCPHRLFELTGMMGYLDVRETLEGAVRALREGELSPAPGTVASEMP